MATKPKKYFIVPKTQTGDLTDMADTNNNSKTTLVGILTAVIAALVAVKAFFTTGTVDFQTISQVVLAILAAFGFAVASDAKK